MLKTPDHQERVVGIEMEYSPSIREFSDSPERQLTEVVEVEVIQSAVLKNIRNRFGYLENTPTNDASNRFLGNGFAAYIDCGSIEVCTPECLPDNVGLAQLASEMIVKQAVEAVIDDEPRWSYLLPLRVQNHKLVGRYEDQMIQSSGMHENYNILDGDRMRFGDSRSFVELYSLTQGVWSGQGLVDSSGRFNVAQKTVGRTSGAKETVRINEGRIEFRRLNYPLSYWQLKHRTAYTSAFIRSLEFLPEDGAKRLEVIGRNEHIGSPREREGLFNPYASLISSKIDFHTALFLQLRIAEKVLEIASKHSFPDYETEAAAEVVRVCNEINDGHLVGVAHEVPWIHKMLGLERKIPEIFKENYQGVDTVNRAVQYCIAMDSFGAGTAAAQRRARQEGSFTEEQIVAATENPPAIPVAIARGKNILRHMEYFLLPGTVAFTDWMTDEVTIK